MSSRILLFTWASESVRPIYVLQRQYILVRPIGLATPPQTLPRSTRLEHDSNAASSGARVHFCLIQLGFVYLFFVPDGYLCSAGHLRVYQREILATNDFGAPLTHARMSFPEWTMGRA
jgi:hypothetical protein